MTRRLALILCALLTTANAARAQSQNVTGAGRVSVTLIATLTIPDMLSLSAVPATQRAHVAGDNLELDGALTLYVSANRSWRLVMDGATAGSDLSWRAGSTSERVHSASAEFIDADAQHEVARGGRGTRLPVRVDYRWVRSNVSAAQVPPVVYSLTAN